MQGAEGHIGSSIAHNWDTADRPPSAANLCPVVISIPHAGRDYPAPLLAQARLPMPILRQLEDGWVDILAQAAIADGFPTLVATRARAAIDLNRASDDIDPAMIADPQSAPHIRPGRRSEAGLGLFPRLLPGAGALWRKRFDWAELAARIDADYHPYHEALAQALALRSRFLGGAILLDMHSMPPPRRQNRDLPIDIVFGTLHGTSCAEWLVSALETCAHAMGWRSMRDHPYAGGHILAQSGRPMQNIHAIQIEISRARYCDSAGAINPVKAAETTALFAALAQAAQQAWAMHSAQKTRHRDDGNLLIAAE
jgi:N-formylglutamate amidohydrolase